MCRGDANLYTWCLQEIHFDGSLEGPLKTRKRIRQMSLRPAPPERARWLWPRRCSRPRPTSTWRKRCGASRLLRRTCFDFVYVDSKTPTECSWVIPWTDSVRTHRNYSLALTIAPWVMCETCEFKHFPSTDPKSGDTDFCRSVFIEALIVSLLTILSRAFDHPAWLNAAMQCASSKGCSTISA